MGKLIILGDIFDTRNEPGDYNRRVCECFNINAFKTSKTDNIIA